MNIVAAFRGMHVSPVKHSYALHMYYQESVTTGQTHAGQSDPYVPICFAGDTKMTIFQILYQYLLLKVENNVCKTATSVLIFFLNA